MKFVILSQPRSGSTLLAEMLNSHSSIQCDGELFNKKRFKSKWGKVKQFIANYWPYFIVWFYQRNQKKAHYGFKLHSSHLKNTEKFINTLHNKGFIILDLRRNDIVKTAFSAAIALTTNQWSVRRKEERLTAPIEINPAILFIRLEHAEDKNNLQNKLVANKNAIQIQYETDLEDETKHAEFSKRICEQLQIPVEPLTCQLIKTDVRPLSERVSNYQSLIEQIKNSRFAIYLNNN